MQATALPTAQANLHLHLSVHPHACSREHVKLALPILSFQQGEGHECEGRTSPRALIAQDSPSSPAVDADSDARLASAAGSAAAVAAAASASAKCTKDGIDAGIAAMNGFGGGEFCTVFCDSAAAPTAVSGGGGFGAAGRRRRKISLLGPEAGTRSSASRWRMRSVLICGRICLA